MKYKTYPTFKKAFDNIKGKQIVVKKRKGWVVMDEVFDMCEFPDRIVEKP